MANRVNVDVQFSATGAERVKGAIQQQSAEIRKLDQSIDSAADSANTLNKKLQATGDVQTGGMAQMQGGGGFSKLDRIGSVGSQLLGGLGQGELAGVAGLIGDAGGAMESLGGAAGILGVSLLGVTAIVGAWNMANKEASKSVEMLMATQEEYYRIIITGTTESVQAAIEAKRIEIEILRARIEENQLIFRRLEEQIGGVGRAFADIFDAGGARRLREDTQRLEDELRNQTFALGRLESALENGVTAANDMESAEEDLAAMRLTTIQQITAATLKADSMTTAERQKQIEANTRQIAILSQLYIDYQGNEEAMTLLQDAIRDLAQETVILGKVTNTAADAEEALNQAREVADARADALFEATTKQTEAYTRLQQATKEYNELADEQGERLLKIERERDRQLNEIERRRIEAAVEASKAILQLEARSADNIYRIRRDAGEEIEESIRRGDAVSARRARRARDKAIELEQSQTEEQKKQLQDRLAQINEAAKAEREALIQSYSERLAEEVAAMNKELAARQEALAQMKTDLDNANAAMLAIAQTAAVQRQATETRTQVNLNEIARQGGEALVGLVKNVFETVKSNFQTSFANLLSGYFLGTALQGQYGSGGGSLGSGSGSGYGSGTGIGGIRSGGLGGSGSRSAGFLPSMTAASRMTAAGGGSQSVNLSFDLRGAAGVNMADLTRQVERQIVPRITQAIREAQ